MIKPSWDEYFMDMTYLIAQRSIDPSTKCGCIIVSDDHAVLSVGYNNPPSDCDDDNTPLGRPEKYDYFVHSEENAILNAARKGISLDGSTAYITGTPCCRCFRGLLGAGIKRIIYGPNTAKMSDEQQETVKKFMNKSHKTKHDKIEIIEFKGKIGGALCETSEYIKNKFGAYVINNNI